MEKLTKENIYIDLRGKSKEELTDLYNFLISVGEKPFRDKEWFLNYTYDNEKVGFSGVHFLGLGNVLYKDKTEVTIQQLKEILQPMDLTLEQQLQKAQLEVERLQSLIEEENKPKVGDIGLFWDNDSPKKIGVLGRIYDNGKDRYKMNGSTCWKNFEKLPEELQKELSNYLK